jgi:hypothetical protein
MHCHVRIEVGFRRPLILDSCLDVSIALVAAIGAWLCMSIILRLVLRALVHRVAGMRG